MNKISSKHEKWLEERRKGIGGSDIACVVGLNPFKSKLQLYNDKVHGSVTEYNDAMKRGVALEAYVVQLFEESTGYKCKKPKKEIVSRKDKPFIKASADRLYVNKDGENSILECKTSGRKIDHENIPVYWFLQLQWYLGTFEMKSGAIAWLNPNYSFEYVEVEADVELYDKLVDAAQEFWENHVMSQVAPPAETSDDVLSLYSPKDLIPSIKATDTLLELCQGYAALNEEVKRLTIEKDKLHDAISVTLGNAEMATYGDEIICTYKFTKPTERVDTKRLRKELPDVCAQFLTVSEPQRKLYIRVGGQG